ncbi:MAG TPA: hypothetical protein VHP36_04930, partial [Chitinispirillaceae bacterium]|nr:hypothetical protein [Chitinispirillaceae bacterium]
MKKKKLSLLRSLSLSLVVYLSMLSVMCNTTGPDEGSQGKVMAEETNDDNTNEVIKESKDSHPQDTAGLKVNSGNEDAKNNGDATTYTTTKISIGYANLNVGDGFSGIEIMEGAIITTSISAKVRTVTREQLISFIDSNTDLFSSEELALLKAHRGVKQPGYEAELLLAISGLKAADDTSNISAHNNTDIAALNELKESPRCKALHQIVGKDYLLTGKVTAVGLSMIPVIPAYFVPIFKVTFSD